MRSTDPTRLASYQLDEERRVKVSLHGPDAGSREDRDVRVEIELGKPDATPNQCFARRDPNGAVWEIDSNPLAHLGSPPRHPAAGRPARDPAGVAQGGRDAIDVVRVERGDESYDVVLKEREGQRRGDASRGCRRVYWNLSFDGNESPTDAAAAMAYNGFLFRIPFARPLDPRGAGEVLAAPVAKVSLLPHGGEPGELVIGQPSGDAVKIYFRPLDALYLAPAAIVDVVAPRPDSLAEGVERNIWEPYLRDR